MSYVDENCCQIAYDGIFTESSNKDGGVVNALCDGDVCKVAHEQLEQRKVCYRRGDSTIVFDPPKEHTHVLLMEHIINERRISENNMFALEKGFDRNCLVYYVERYIYHSDDFYDPDNKVVLTCLVGKREETREIMFMYFFCGAYCTWELSDEEQEIVKRYRELINAKFEIRRF